MAAAINFVSQYVAEGELILDHIDQQQDVGSILTPPTKCQMMMWKCKYEPALKKFKIVLSARKLMLAVLWDMKRIIYKEYSLPGITITADRCIDTLMCLQKAIKWKSLYLLSQKVVLVRDNAHVYSARHMWSSLQMLYWDVFGQPVYSPHLTSDNHVFSPLKVTLGSQHFISDAELKKFTWNYFRKLGTEKYVAGICKLVYRYEKCLERYGSYVEK